MSPKPLLQRLAAALQPRIPRAKPYARLLAVKEEKARMKQLLSDIKDAAEAMREGCVELEDIDATRLS